MGSEEDCIVCSAGSFCPTGSGEESACAPGTFSDEPEAASCVKCPAGSFQELEGAASCSACIAGSYCPEGASAALVCSAGSFSDATNLTSDRECRNCPVGHACAAGSTHPSPCAAGSHARSESAGSCDLCAAGYYQPNTGQAECIKCTAGSLCPIGASLELPAACTPGTYANRTDADGDPDCFECEAGFSCPGGAAEPRACAPGSFAANMTRSECEPCAAGSYQEEASATSCKECEAGSFCLEGASSPLPCPAGRRSNDTIVMGSEEDCIVCSAGSFCPTGSGEESACAPGTFSDEPEAASCVKCPAGSFQELEGATSCSACIAGSYCPEGASAALVCSAGSFSDATNLTSDRECRNCPVGHACAAGSTHPSPCAAGSHARSESAGSCDLCAAGYYQPNTGQAECIKCTAGSLCPIGASLELPAACTPGTFADMTDEDGSPDCFECPAGSFCPGGAAPPAPCFPGSFAAFTGQVECEACTAGTYQGEVNATACEECDPGNYCSKGATSPLPCPAGSRKNTSLPVMRSVDDCIMCEAGTFCPTGSAVATDCAPGTFINRPGADICGKCPAGQFQDEPGATSCKPCEPGRYCATGSSASLPCPAGRRTNVSLEAMTSDAQCIVCSAGMFCPTGSSQETPCAPGSYGAETGLETCEFCTFGTYAEGGATSCTECPAGKYADTIGQGLCVPCPFPLSSDSGSTICSKCQAGYYLSDPEANPESIFQNPSDHCTTCPTGLDCTSGISLETLPLPASSWRASSSSSKIYTCFVDSSGYSPCRGGARRSQSQDEDQDDGKYCISGHRGPLCQVCIDSAKYYDADSGRCLDCSRASRIGVFAGLALGTATLLWLLHFGLHRDRVKSHWLVRRAFGVASNVNLQAKAKILISFFQVFNTLDAVYGVQLHPDFSNWLNFLAAFNFDVLNFVLPGKCAGSMSTRLLVNAGWPLPLFIVLVLGAAARAYFTRKCTPSADASRSTDSRNGTNLAIMLLFLVLPSVSRSIFSARKCVSFGFEDATGSSRSFLIADLDLRCGGSEYEALSTQFWVWVGVWLVVVPFLGLGLVLKVRQAIQEQRASTHASWCRFLWKDYNKTFLYWEFVDMARKLFLTSVILFFDPEFGDIRLQRLIIACIVTTTYLAVLAISRPYSRQSDLYMACISNLFLASCFASGIAIKLCSDPAQCTGLLGISDAYGANQFAVALTVAMLVLSSLVIVENIVSRVTAVTIRLASTGWEPDLELPKGCDFHCFLSHAWKTGQDQTHSLVRKLQLLLPTVKIWLDVDHLEDVGKLEECVQKSAVFVIFLSAGYFESFNCRRELYTALALGKPIVLMHEADKEKGGSTWEELKTECRNFCNPNEYLKAVGKIAEEPNDGLKVSEFTENDSSEEIIDCIFSNEPIAWVRVNIYQIESLKLVASRILQQLPNHHSGSMRTTNSNVTLQVKGEQGRVSFSSTATPRLLVCETNAGAEKVANEVLKEATAEGGRAAPESALLAPELQLQSPQTVSQKQPAPILLVYLNDKTFPPSLPDRPEASEIEVVISRALKNNVAIALVHEQDPAQGALAFREIYKACPASLVRHKLFDVLAEPLYPRKEHRIVSLRRIARGMGATAQTRSWTPGSLTRRTLATCAWWSPGAAEHQAEPAPNISVNPHQTLSSSEEAANRHQVSDSTGISPLPTQSAVGDGNGQAVGSADVEITVIEDLEGKFDIDGANRAESSQADESCRHEKTETRNVDLLENKMLAASTASASDMRDLTKEVGSLTKQVKDMQDLIQDSLTRVGNSIYSLQRNGRSPTSGIGTTECADGTRSLGPGTVFGRSEKWYSRRMSWQQWRYRRHRRYRYAAENAFSSAEALLHGANRSSCWQHRWP